MAMFAACWSRLRLHNSLFSRMSLLSALPVLLLVALSTTKIHASVEKTLSATAKTGESVSVMTAHSSTAAATAATSSETGNNKNNNNNNSPIHANVLSHVAARTPLLNLEGIDLAHFKTIQGHRLFLNGAGTRAIRFMGMNFKVYVAAFYALQHVDTAEAILARFNNHNNKHDGDDRNDEQQQKEDDCLYQIDFTFLRSVGQSKVTQAWREQLEYSVSHTYDGYEKDRDAFIAMFGPIQNGGTETVQLIGDDTVVYDQGEYKGIIEGRDFQQAFLSVWFGEKAVAADLKSGLLGKVTLDDKNVLAVLRAAAAEGGNRNGHYPPLIIQVAAEEGSSVYTSYTTGTTSTLTVVESESSPPTTTVDEKQPELCHQ